jgi:RHH-type transcriptional regulator, proline utilization regulon repressor / proline dehydrogenase / delta 1-pyrroline-5-carboxylate dehydrogenase
MAPGPARSWIHPGDPVAPDPAWARITRHYLADERETVSFLLGHARVPHAQAEAVRRRASRLVEAMRQRHRQAKGLDAFLGEYDLSSREGIVLMCLAEALLRIPDSETADRLIADKIGAGNWAAHLGASESLFVNASTWALMLTGRMLKPKPSATNWANSEADDGADAFLARLAERVGEPVVRSALRQGMRILGQQFVMGRTIDEALTRAGRRGAFRYSFDMLGEAAMTDADADAYFDTYRDAIDRIAAQSPAGAAPMDAHGISVKLSALDPRFEHHQRGRVLGPVAERLTALAVAAAQAGIGLTVDAEEADRIELTLAVFDRVARGGALASYAGLGIAVQAYQKRAWHVLNWLDELGHSMGRLIPVRLVKGAYWDTEIKRAQEQGLAGYPVFTRKSSTDVSYLACAKLLLTGCPHLYPQFATHNAHTVAWLLETAPHRHFEFQRLHGMGEELYTDENGSPRFDRPCRVYAPVGSHERLLPYLVRRLLENGANTSFVNRLAHADAPIDEIIADPAARTEQLEAAIANPRIPLPEDLYGQERRNSRGWNLADDHALAELRTALAAVEPEPRVTARVAGEPVRGETIIRTDPADRRRVACQAQFADAAVARAALKAAHGAQPAWNATPPAERARILRRAADLFDADTAGLVACCVGEGGRTVADSLAELREAVDFLRYYAAQCEALFAHPIRLPGPTGERNELRLSGRGVFLCISPWNFPLAIFTGQLAAALAAGNTVLAKPAEQAALTAARAVALLSAAGVPDAALQFLPGRGAVIGDALLGDERIAGVAFTGSVETARHIARALARRDGPLATLIAETGGINAMIADSSALTEQLVRDAAFSAFNSAGQRCSALRLLCLQDDIADHVIAMLRGWMDRMVIGDPALLDTDVGPVIDEDARQMLEAYVAEREQRVLHRCPLDAAHAHGCWFPPTLIGLDSVAELDREVFGPILHVVRYHDADVDALVDAINANGFGLTLGVHSRIDSVAQRIASRARVGNVYVNRNMIGAVVGVQPFGGMGLSGTGPKAGGPLYLPRFAVEQTVTVNTTAVGGNATLLSLGGSQAQSGSGADST